MRRATTRQWWNSNPGQYNSKGHALIFTPVSKSMGYRHFCLLAVWVRNNWNPGAAGHDYEPKESALEHNHFPQVIDCNGDDSSSHEAGITEVVPRNQQNEQRGLGHKSPQHTQLRPGAWSYRHRTTETPPPSSELLNLERCPGHLEDQEESSRDR